VRSLRVRLTALISGVALIFTLAVVLALATQSTQAQTFTVLYSVTGLADGGNPLAGLVLDSAGNLYGTTNEGGTGLFNCLQGCGTVFKVDTAGNETVLHSFGETSTDGEYPYYGSLFRDGAGNLYGTTGYGGTYGNGTIFRLNTSGTEAVFSFTGGANGGFPYSGLVLNGAGSAFGTTQDGGSGCSPYGCGTVFRVNSAGKVTVLHSFIGVPDGEYPISGVVLDSAGNLYGTTPYGGSVQRGRLHLPTYWGTVFKVDPSGKETQLYSFCPAGLPCTDGQNPMAGLVRDSAGNLYGTTQYGGANSAGTVFRVDPTGNETALYSFCSQSGCADGSNPTAGLVLDNAGNLYGTTEFGGANREGTLFEVDTNSVETVLYSFCSQANCTDGVSPYAGLVLDSAGNLYGTTQSGGAYFGGTVFKLTPGTGSARAGRATAGGQPIPATISE
jgi:uncharacterized repeat protein (TIGR03803 family)